MCSSSDSVVREHPAEFENQRSGETQHRRFKTFRSMLCILSPVKPSDFVLSTYFAATPCMGMFHLPFTLLPSQTPLTQWNSAVCMLAEPPAKSFAVSLGNLGKCILGKPMSMPMSMRGNCARNSTRKVEGDSEQEE